MIFFIPGELIALITFPGVIIHEIAHRFFCDFNKVPVYGIQYFIPLSENAGCVIHERTSKLSHAFFIASGPLIVNSIVCMLLTFPYMTPYYLGTDFLVNTSFRASIGYSLLVWIGMSAGFNAIPSN